MLTRFSWFDVSPLIRSFHLNTDMDRMHWDVTDAHIKRVQAETEVRRLAAMLRQKDDELRKSIEAQWQMYYRLNPTAQRF